MEKVALFYTEDCSVMAPSYDVVHGREGERCTERVVFKVRARWLDVTIMIAGSMSYVCRLARKKLSSCAYVRKPFVCVWLFKYLLRLSEKAPSPGQVLSRASLVCTCFHFPHCIIDMGIVALAHKVKRAPMELQ